MEVSEELETLVKREINRLQIPPTIRGYRYLVYIIGQVAVDHDRVIGITKDLYRETARRFKTSWTAVERSSRLAITFCWESEKGRGRFCTLAGHQFAERPTTSVFVTIVAMHITDNYRIGT